MPTPLLMWLLMPNTTCTITIFAPSESDTSFFALKYYRQPPLTLLLKYHVAPVKLEKNDLDVVSPLGSKVNTLLPGHPAWLSITTSSHQENLESTELRSSNGISTTMDVLLYMEWFNFFDMILLAYQTILYPWWFNEVVSINTLQVKLPLCSNKNLYLCMLGLSYWWLLVQYTV
ncbi:hypothetical protein FRX31_030277 [Thalictrum thalictroides]|uniref:FAS1 domain-containing protein n=1 Tax=Thalictrum thalictroides TaxID=46969 RepID=A0A7J6V621_THATH|nr:hypothetical protein FRX31_030277 [Thalictrum thalictroides]